MKVRLCSIALFAGLMAATITVAQEATPKARHHRYRVIDVGTFGGPNADTLVPPPAAHILTNSGLFVGTAETKLVDPFAPNCVDADCLVQSGLLNVAGFSVNIGTLRHGYSGGPVSVNDFGVAVGFSQNGELDPLTGNPEFKAALWKDGHVIDLGTLGGNGASANAITDDGLIFGGALNTIPDSDSGDPFFVPGATQVHAVLWMNGKIQDLGTLGGSDSVVYQTNNSRQAMGISFTDNVRHESTGLPTTHPFLWERGQMYDVGSLGGTKSIGYGLNSRGEIVGFSRLAGDTMKHPFLWTHRTLRDLGTLGGAKGEAWWINDLGHVVGWSDVPGNLTHHAFLWRNHQMKDLGTPDGNACSTGEKINRFDQVVGDSGECEVGGDPFLWEDDDIVAIRDLIIPGSGRFIFDAFDINDQGEIVSYCATPQGNVHICLLVPVEANIPELPPRNSQPSSLIAPAKRYPVSGERRTAIP